jgi:hypothetical protein
LTNTLKIQNGEREDEGGAPEGDRATGSVSVEGDHAVIRVPLSQVHALRVALAPCPCRAPKSNSNAEVRARLARALGTLRAAPGRRP